MNKKVDLESTILNVVEELGEMVISGLTSEARATLEIGNDQEELEIIITVRNKNE